MKFSIVIPTYNYSKYISRCIGSVLEQDFDNFEIVVIDDGSTDNTSEVVNKIIQNSSFDRIKYYYQENQGVSVARNNGVKHSKGDYIWFLDSDDILLPNAIKHATKYLSKYTSVDYIYGGYNANYVDGPVVNRYPSQLSGNKLKDFEAILDGKLKGINTGCIIFKKSVFETFLFDPEVYTGQDFALFAKVIATKSGQMVNELFAEKTRHPDSLRDDYVTKVRTGTKMVDAIFNDPNLGDEFKALRSKFLARRLLTLSRVYHRNGDHQLAVQYYLKGLKSNYRVIKRTRYLRCYLASVFLLLKEKMC